MVARAHRGSRAGIGKATRVGSKKTTPSERARQQAITNSIKATLARKAADHRVDWDAVIKRFKADMAKRYSDAATASEDGSQAP